MTTSRGELTTGKYSSNNIRQYMSYKIGAVAARAWLGILALMCKPSGYSGKKMKESRSSIENWISDRGHAFHWACSGFVCSVLAAMPPRVSSQTHGPPRH